MSINLHVYHAPKSACHATIAFPTELRARHSSGDSQPNEKHLAPALPTGSAHWGAVQVGQDMNKLVHANISHIFSETGYSISEWRALFPWYSSILFGERGGWIRSNKHVTTCWAVPSQPTGKSKWSSQGNDLHILNWLVVYLPLWKIWVRQLGRWNSQLFLESHKIPWFQSPPTSEWCWMFYFTRGMMPFCRWVWGLEITPAQLYPLGSRSGTAM